MDVAFESSEEGFRQTQTSDPVWNYKFRVLRAEALAGLGRFSDSLATLEIDPPPQLASSEFAVRRRIIQSRALCRLNNYSEAALRIDEAENLARTGYPDLLGEVAQNHGACLNSQNDPEAQAYFVQALAFARQHQQPFLQVNAQGSLGLISMQRRRYDEAIDRFKDALSLARGLNARRAEEKTLGNIGISFFELGDFPNASSNTMQAEALASNLHNPDDERFWLRALGDQYLAQNNYDKAATAYLHALDLSLSLNNQEDSEIGECLHDLAQIEIRRHNLSKAEEYNHRVQALGGSGPDSPLYVASLLTSAEIAAARQEYPKSEELLNRLLADKKADDSLSWQAQIDLADLYVAWGKPDKAEQAFRDGIHIVETARSEISQEEKKLSILDVGPVYDGYVRFLMEHGREIQAMEVTESSRARTLLEGMGIDAPKSKLDISKIQRTLHQNEIILAYWLSDKESYLWAVTPTQIKPFRLPQKHDIDQAVESYSAQLRDRRSMEDSPAGSTLYNILIKPAESLLPKTAHVIVIPHGSLYKLNYETLIVPGVASHYWIDDVVIENTSSMAFRFMSRQKTGIARKQMLLMGNPVQATPEYPQLKNAAEEMNYVAGHFPAGQTAMIAEKNATPDAYFAAKPENYRYIDFVTHGTAVPLSPLDSAIVLSPDKDTSYKLYAHDIIKRPIHAEIVTISACYGAGERTYSGEGLVGLAWAFMRAGSHRVVAALWEAEDAVTPKLMNDFYNGLQNGKNVADSLRAAKLKMLHARDLNARPYYWASLQLYAGP